MMTKRISIAFSALMSVIAGSATAETVTAVSVAGNVVKLTLGANACELTPINDFTVKVEYKPNNQTTRCSEIVDSSLSTTLAFSDIQQSADPIVLTGANYIVKIPKNPFAIQFTDKSGAALFTSTTVTASQLAGQVVQGNYYGVMNDPNSNLTQPSNAQTIVTPYQGKSYAPLIWTTKRLGLLMDAEKATITRNAASFSCARNASVNTNNLFFLMTGAPRQILQNYYRVTGFFPMPPLWSLGFLNSEWGMNQTQMLGFIYKGDPGQGNRSYRGLDIPLDGYILDYDWFNSGQSNGGDFSWNANNFPDGPTSALKRTCDSVGVKLIGIRKPRILNVEQNFYQASVQANYWTQMKTHNGNYTSGLVGYWNDEADYGDPFNFLYFQKCMYKGQRADYPNLRVWSINRGYEGGAHRYAYGLWSGDINTDFGTMANQRRFMLSAINIGAAWWSMDIGGFQGHPSNENYYRWMEFGAFVPIYRVHGTNGEQREPWYYGADGLANATKFIRIRYSLLPYIYSAYYKLHLFGLPIVRPLAMDYPDDNNTATDVNSWLFGDNMLVAPVMAQGATNMTFYLPSEKWVSFWNDQDTVTGGKQVTVPVTADMIPVYIKRGAVIPQRPYGRYTTDPLVTSITFNVYGGGNGSFDYYEDDGLTYNYETGANCHIVYDHQSGPSGERLIVSAQEGTFTPAQKTGYMAFHNVNSVPDTVKVPGQVITASRSADTTALKSAAAPSWCYNAAAKTAIIKTANPFAPGTFAVIIGSTGVRPSPATPAADLMGLRVQEKTLRLRITIPNANSSVILRLINSRGEIAKTLYDAGLRAGDHDIALPVAAMPSGAYSLAIMINNVTVTSRRVVIFR